MIFAQLFHIAGGNYVVGCAMCALCKARCRCSGTYVFLTLLFAECGRAAATITIMMMLADGYIGTGKLLDFWHPMTSLHRALLPPGAGGQPG